MHPKCNKKNAKDLIVTHSKSPDCVPRPTFHLGETVSTPDFPLTLARWPMASEHCRRTSDFLSYWPGLASGISKIAEK